MTTGRPNIKRPTVTGSVAEYIRRRIINAEFSGGDVIRQEALAAELGVSRIPVREALLQLEAEGLVVIHTHRGAAVVALTPEDAIDLFDARQMMEPVLVKQAVTNLTDADVTRIEQAMLAYERAVRVDAEPEELSRLNWEFHTAMCLPAKRPRLVAILQSLYTASDRYLRMQIDSPKAKELAIADHRQLFDAMRRRSRATAFKLIKEHISGAYEDVARGLDARAASKKGS